MKINAKLLACATLYQAEDDVRFYLNGVNLAPGKDGKGVEIVSTNGHVIFVSFDESAEFIGDQPFTIEIPSKAVTQLKKRNNIEASIDERSPGNWVLAVGGKTFEINVMHDKFPDWRYIIPFGATQDIGTTENETAYIAGPYIEILGITSSLLHPTKPVMSITTPHATSAAFARFHSSNGQAIAMVMPVKMDPLKAPTFI